MSPRHVAVTPHRPLRREVPAALACAALAATCWTVAAPSANAGTLVIRNVRHPAVVVTMHGEGHGHGMSQYGAQGAALAGRSYRQIVGFYYPHTKLASAAGTSIRVRISGVGSTTTIWAAPTLAVTGVSGTLPYAGVARYRLVAGSGHSESLQRLATGSTRWATVHSGLRNDTEFVRRDGHSLRLLRTDGRSTAYLGRLRAVRQSGSGSSSGVFTVNRLSLEAYTAGVVPREMPASWARQALAAQAVAARTYGLYAVRHPRTSSYDICDTTNCQVYGGVRRYSSHGRDLWDWDPRAASDSASRVLTYGGRVIFAQFSASNGGEMASGGEPYLVAGRDPYDSTRSGDPFLSYNRTVPVADIAQYYGLTKVTKIVVTRRDGHGTGGGRILSGYVYGLRGKKSTRVATTGDDLNWALGAGTTWFTLRNA